MCKCGNGKCREVGMSTHEAGTTPPELIEAWEKMADVAIKVAVQVVGMEWDEDEGVYIFTCKDCDGRTYFVYGTPIGQEERESDVLYDEIRGYEEFFESPLRGL